jgi:hypothetical protein
MEQTQSDNGFVYIATLSKLYLISAINSAGSLRDHYPTARITLYTTPDLLDGVNTDVFDSVITEDVPADRRAKLWALSRSPYKLTAYLDADTVITSDEISTIFDQLKDNDIIFTKIRPYNSNTKGYIDHPGYIYHGGVFVYNNTPQMLSFMSQWWNLWSTTRKNEVFESTYPEYPIRMKEWDQFYLFYLLNHTDHGLKVGVFENDARWNFVIGYRREELNGLSTIIEHYTIKPK